MSAYMLLVAVVCNGCRWTFYRQPGVTGYVRCPSCGMLNRCTAWLRRSA